MRTTRISKYVLWELQRCITLKHLAYIGCSFCLLDVQNILSADTGIFRQTEGHSFGDHLISKSVSVTPSSVIEASIVLCSVFLWLVWVNVQSACALNTRYIYWHVFMAPWPTIKGFGLDLLTPSSIITLIHNQWRHLTINECLRPAPFWVNYDSPIFWYGFHCEWRLIHDSLRSESQITANQFVLAPGPLRLTTIYFLFNWTLAVIVLL
jgi:hypothetical protein